jgi:hypothetical protein
MLKPLQLTFYRFFFAGLLVALCTASAMSQVNPVCSQLSVEAVEMDNDSTMKVTLHNSCKDCSHAAYCDLFVIRGDSDTIASSGCFCLFSPANDSSEVFYIPAFDSAGPSMEGLRISMPCVCDTFPFSTAMGYSMHGTADFSVYPNPSGGSFTVDPGSLTGFTDLYLRDMQGNTILHRTLSGHKEEMEDIPPGAFILTLTGRRGGEVHKKVLIVP